MNFFLAATLTACVGFTGAKCDYSYPFNECGFRQAMADVWQSGQSGTIKFASGTIIMAEEDFSCPLIEQEWRMILTDGSHYWHPSKSPYPQPVELDSAPHIKGPTIRGF